MLPSRMFAFFLLVCSLGSQWPAPNSTDQSSRPAFFDPKWQRGYSAAAWMQDDQSSVLFGSMPFRAGQWLIRYLVNGFLKCLLPSKPAKRLGFLWSGICLFLGRFLVFYVLIWKQIGKLEGTGSLEKEWWHFYVKRLRLNSRAPREKCEVWRVKCEAWLSEVWGVKWQLWNFKSPIPT